VKEVSGVSAETGTVELFPNANTTYVLAADNAVGDAISPESRAVTVTTPARLVFSPNPVAKGGQVELTGSTAVNGGDLYSSDIVVRNAPGTGFIDIGATGLPLPFQSGDDTVSKVLELPQPLSIRGAGTPVGGSKVSVSVNGWMVFSDIARTGTAWLPFELPSADLGPGILAVWPSDLLMDDDSRILWRVDQVGSQKRLIVQWDDLTLPFRPNERVTFQAQLYDGGEVVFAYKDFTELSWEWAPIGIDSPDGTSAVVAGRDQLNASLRPDPGDTFRFFEKLTLPWSFEATGKPMTVTVDLGNGHQMQIQDAPALTSP
jgi:hypothetical protein